MAALNARQYDNCRNGYDGYGNCYSSWDSWARWVVLGAIIVGALLIFFLFSCITARRRRKMGYAPYRGTGWVPGTGRNNNPAPPPENYSGGTPYYASNQYAAPPPTYQGYYGRGNDTEMQPPTNDYGNVYPPPAGAPPRKY